MVCWLAEHVFFFGGNSVFTASEGGAAGSSVSASGNI